jgi:hypothetical protein
MATDPSFEELSAYVDGELEPGPRAQIDAHLATCAGCRARTEALRSTVNAIRAMPMDTPPRTFTVPVQRRQSWRWAPAGWAGGAAAALVLVAIGITQLHGGAGSSSTAQTSNSRVSGGLAAPADKAAGSPAFLDQHGSLQASNAFPNHASVADPSDGTRQLSLAADAVSYPSNGSVKVSVVLQGSPSSALNASQEGLTLVLVREGYGVVLADPIGISSYNGTPVFGATYKLGGLPLTQQRAGDYRLVATWVIPDGSGHVLQAGIPIRLTGK